MKPRYRGTTLIVEDDPKDTLPLANRVAASAIDLVTAGVFLFCWVWPIPWRKTLPAELGFIIGVEFLVIHAGFFIARAPIVAAVVLTLAYSAAAWAVFSFAGVSAWLAFGAFAWLLLDRITSVLSGPQGQMERQWRQNYFWSCSMAFYIGGAFIALFVWIPPLGLGWYPTRRLPGWSMEVESVMAWGFLYFTALGLTKLFERRSRWDHRG
jgi:hypothetical protein